MLRLLSFHYLSWITLSWCFIIHLPHNFEYETLTVGIYAIWWLTFQVVLKSVFTGRQFQKLQVRFLNSLHYQLSFLMLTEALFLFPFLQKTSELFAQVSLFLLLPCIGVDHIIVRELVSILLLSFKFSRVIINKFIQRKKWWVKMEL